MDTHRLTPSCCTGRCVRCGHDTRCSQGPDCGFCATHTIGHQSKAVA